MRPGQQATQAVHAAFSFSVKCPEVVSEWHDASNNLVLLSVPDENALLSLLDQFAATAHVAVHEPDLGDALTAIAIAPSPETSRLLSHLPLALREEVVMA